MSHSLPGPVLLLAAALLQADRSHFELMSQVIMQYIYMYINVLFHRVKFIKFEYSKLAIRVFDVPTGPTW